MSNVQIFPEELFCRIQLCGKGLSSEKQASGFIDSMIQLLFPLHNCKDVKIAHFFCEWEQQRCLFANILSSLDLLLHESPEDLLQRFFDFSNKNQRKYFFRILFDYFC